MARIAFTAAFAEAYAWPAPDAATFKAALLGSPGPTVSIKHSFHPSGPAV